MIKKVLTIIGGFLVLLLAGLYLFVDSEVYTERSIVVDTAPQFAFDQAHILPNWDNWSPYDDDDPTITVTYSGQASGPGAYFTWAGEKAGAGKLTITESEAPSSIKTKLEFDGQGEGYGTWSFTSEGSGTKVTWGFGADMGMSPLGKIFALMMPGRMSTYLDKGLGDLKKAAEADVAKPIPMPAPEPESDPSSEVVPEEIEESE
ncbi:MAG: SRPBCC family protein [Bacteroidota bacterium]